jgi:hypothetical protein
MKTMRVLVWFSCAVIFVMVSGCGGKAPSGRGEASTGAETRPIKPTAAEAAAAYAKAEEAAPKAGGATEAAKAAEGAAFGVEFIEGNTSNLCAAQRIYMRAVDGEGRTLYGTSVTTNQLGVGQFSGVPLETRKLEFIDSIKRRGELRVDLAPFAREKRGELAGSCAF